MEEEDPLDEIFDPQVEDDMETELDEFEWDITQRMKDEADE